MGKARILIAESHVGTARELGKLLSELDYQPIAVVTRGERVLLKVDEDAPDLVLMTYRLPGGISAVQVARQIRAKGIPTVFVLNKADDRLFQRAGITQTFDYILKPYDKRQLNLVIDAALYRHVVEAKLGNLQDYHRNQSRRRYHSAGGTERQYGAANRPLRLRDGNRNGGFA